jgi:hypothetical protein
MTPSAQYLEDAFTWVAVPVSLRLVRNQHSDVFAAYSSVLTGSISGSYPSCGNGQVWTSADIETVLDDELTDGAIATVPTLTVGESGSHRIPRWRGVDSNSSFRNSHHAAQDRPL